jgi:hypothetical protein
MLALSIRQPWAGLLILAVKRAETREPHGMWQKLPTYIVGKRIAIHASKTYDRTAFVRIADETGNLTLRRFEDHPFCRASGLLGTAVVEKVDWCLDGGTAHLDALCECGGCVGIWMSRRLVLPQPIPYKGMLGFFQVPDELLAGAA